MALGRRRALMAASLPPSCCACSSSDLLSAGAHTDRVSGQEYRLIFCRACGVVFAEPRLPVGADWYEKAVPLEPAVPAERDWRFRMFFREGLPDDKLLDVGCGDGRFIRLARKRGYPSCVGFDYDQRKTREARAAGVEAYTQDWGDFCRARGEGEFGIVTLFDVLEHVPEPGTLLREVRRLLKPGGYLVVTLPNAERPLPFGREEYDFPPHHFTRWTPKALAGFLQRQGFAVARQDASNLELGRFLETLVTQSAIKPAAALAKRLLFGRARAQAGSLSELYGGETPAPRPLFVRLLAGKRLRACLFESWKTFWTILLWPLALALALYYRMTRKNCGDCLYTIARKGAVPLGLVLALGGSARAAVAFPQGYRIETSTVAPQIKEKINREVPPESPYVAKAADLQESAVGPGYTMIPLPAFTYNRNEGAWIGGLLPIFRANDKGEVEDIYAPLYLHNNLIGETFTFNYFGYRNKTTQYHAVLSHATKVEREVDVGYKEIAALDGSYIFGVQVNSGKSAFNRFFGLGNNTQQQLETQYTMNDSLIKLNGGFHISPDLSLIATERYRDVRIEDGVSPTLPQTTQNFPDLPGIDGANIVGHGLTLSYDTRDNQLTPLSGTYATLFGEYDQNIKFTERNRWWRVTGEARNFLPHADDRAVFVSHFLVDAVVGQDENSSQEDVIEENTGQVDDQGNPILQPLISKRLIRRGVPFYERPTLGGQTTLRGFGIGRFVSNSAYLLNLEERISLAQRVLMGNIIELELAPFVDMGRVGRSFSSQGIIRRIQVNPGCGLRLLARPNIAARLDVGYGEDGATVFVGLDYPF